MCVCGVGGGVLAVQWSRLTYTSLTRLGVVWCVCVWGGGGAGCAVDAPHVHPHLPRLGVVCVCGGGGGAGCAVDTPHVHPHLPG